jgi:dihydrofolate reductase
MTSNRVIGKDNALPWVLPADLQHFRKLTLHHTVLMGRKTFESLPKLLPLRKHVILSRSERPTGLDSQVQWINSIDEIKPFQGNLFVIGGAEIYNLALPLASTIHLTVIHDNILGDAFFPELNAEWKMTSLKQGLIDDANTLPHEFQTWVRG